MIVRRIHNDELKRVHEIASLAFENRMDCKKTPDEFYEWMVGAPRSRADMDAQCYLAAFEDDDKTMMSAMCAIPFTVRFDGAEASMYGIGNVSTLPVYRRRGGIRACFEQALCDMAAGGAVFSYLYPFSTAYYRRFGYELACEKSLVKLRLEAIPRWETGGYAKLCEAESPCREAVKAVYDVWAKRYNMMTLDEQPVDYAWLDDVNPFRDREYTYVCFAADSAPKGYMTFQPQNEDGSRDLKCSRFVFADTEGLKGLLTLLKSFQSDHPTASFVLPTDIDWQPLIPEASFGMYERKTECAGMARVINVPEAMRLAKPRGSGRLVLEIADAQIAGNNGRFEWLFENGKTTGVKTTQATPDMSMGIGDFTRLLLGRYDASAVAYMDGVTLNCAEAEAAKVFYRKPLYIIRYF